MARRKTGAATTTVVAQGKTADEIAAESFPKNGDTALKAEADQEAEELDDEDVMESGELGQKPVRTIESLQEDMIRMQREHAEEVAALRRQQSPTVKKEEGQVEDEIDKVDWSNELFSNPKESVRKIVKRAVDEATTKLEGKYRAEQNQNRFWAEFDKQAPDLAKDRDLVQLTMNANLSELANMPVEKAMEKLADLTRNRILRYTGQRPKGKKAFAEGSGQPTPKPEPTKAEPIVRLTDIIKARKAKRLGKASAA